ncbi:MAG: tripartite tricarboxylate transporter substrate binding protein [Burkholderiaceae bacterium]
MNPLFLSRRLLLVACLVPALAAAQSFPSRPIRLIVPYAPGGNTDIVARIYSQKLSERLGQPVVIDNRGGAIGTLGVALAAKAPNDGYTIVIGDLGSMVIANHAVQGLSYNSQKDLAPIALVSSVSIVVTTHPKSPFNSFEEILARARAQPGKLTYGTGGTGSPGHMAMELVRAMTKVDVLHVPFKGGAQAVTALLGEQIDFLVDGTALAQVKGGKLKAIAVTGPRLPALPDTPGIGETVPGFAFTNWWGFLAPAGTPADAINRLNEEFRFIAALPEVREKLSGLGLAAQSGTAQQFADHLRLETEKVGRIVRDAGIKFE